MHRTAVAALILAFQGMVFAIVISLGSPLGLNPAGVGIMVSVLIIGMVVTHTFLDIIPSVFLGAPNEDTALSVLPGHRMVKEGKGYDAIRCSAAGSFGAVFFSLLAVAPARLIMGSPIHLYDKLMTIVPWILITVSAYMILGEKSTSRKTTLGCGEREPVFIDHLRQKMFALGIFLMAGILGIIVLNKPLATHNPLLFPQLESNMLFPLFTGLFGIAGLLLSLWDETEVVEQHTQGTGTGLSQKATTKSIAAGSLAGGMVGWLPGISSASATVVAQALTNRGEKEDADKEFLVAISGVNTSNAMFTI